MIPITAGQIAAAVGGTLYGPDRAASAVSTDSRRIEPGSWFVPLAGERFDGHDYIGMALEKGAVGCLCAVCRRRGGRIGPMCWYRIRSGR